MFLWCDVKVEVEVADSSMKWSAGVWRMASSEGRGEVKHGADSWCDAWWSCVVLNHVLFPDRVTVADTIYDDFDDLFASDVLQIFMTVTLEK